MPEPATTHPDPAPPARGRGGRKRDASRDAAILEATLDVLADAGWDGLTMDLVAQRAKAGKATLYRRWPSKDALVLDAVTRMGTASAGVTTWPDTGTLAGDLLALLRPDADTERHIAVMVALTSMLPHHPDLADRIDAALHDPWVEANRVAIERAIARGDFPPHPDVDILARVLPSMITNRILLQHRGVDPAFVTRLVDQVLLPALRAGATTP